VSIYNEIFINDSIDAARSNILKVNIKKINSLKRSMRRKTADEIMQSVSKSKEAYVKFFDHSALEVIMAAEEIIRERIKAC
jgi:hypothetical protein